jgi:hypothetical protein
VNPRAGGALLLLVGLAMAAYGVYTFVTAQRDGSLVVILGVVLVLCGAAIGGAGLVLRNRRPHPPRPPRDRSSI